MLMSAPYLTRLCLLAALLFSQAVYAGHAVAHDNGNQLDCQLCLHTSTGTAALPHTEVTPTFFVPPYFVSFTQHTTVHTASTFQKSHPGRAPPFFSL